MAYWRGTDGVVDGLLGNGGVWTSRAALRERHDTVQGVAFSDQSGTLVIEQSLNGVNWDFASSISVTGGTGKDFSVALFAPFWRVKYTNGATPQNSFRVGVTTQAGGDS